MYTRLITNGMISQAAITRLAVGELSEDAIKTILEEDGFSVSSHEGVVFGERKTNERTKHETTF